MPDAIAAAEFYEEVLGFRVSDWILVPGMGRLGAFMHCNTRHHSFAFFANPQPRKLIHHVMMEYTSIDDVGSGYDIALERELDAYRAEIEEVGVGTILQEAGGIIEAPDGRPLRAPLDTTSPIAWMGYANPTLARTVRPVLRRLMKKHF